jgi:site-specific DNA recombinase
VRRTRGRKAAGHGAFSEDSASGKLVEGILASIAEFYSANLVQEIRKGLDQKAAQGG